MSLLIATPMYGGMCHERYFASCMELKESLIHGGMDHDWLTTTNESLITRARNTSAASFLKTSFQKLMFIDADIEFRAEDVAMLWNMNLAVVCGAYRMKTQDSKLSVWKDGKLVEADGFSEPTAVDYAGTGFMMIDRSVFEVLMENHPQWEHQEGNIDGNCWGFFQDPIEDGFHMSEDYFFCKRWRELGGEIIWHPQVKLTHWGQCGYRSE